MQCFSSTYNIASASAFYLSRPQKNLQNHPHFTGLKICRSADPQIRILLDGRFANYWTDPDPDFHTLGPWGSTKDIRWHGRWGMTNYHIGKHRTTSGHIEVHRTTSDHMGPHWATADHMGLHGTTTLDFQK